MDINKYDLQNYIINFIRQFGLIRHNIKSFDALVENDGLNKVLQGDFNREYFIEITSKNTQIQ
jgi:hypothetical protein